MITDSRIRRVVAVLYCAIIVLLAIWFCVSPKKSFSHQENRYLAKAPVFSVKGILTGDYMEDVSAWLSDQFPMRDFFMGLKSAVEIGAGRREINGVYIAQDDYLIEAYQKPANTERIGDTLRKFYDKTAPSGVDIRLMLVPTAVAIYQGKLPGCVPVADQMETAKEIFERSGIPAIDCNKQLVQAQEEGPLYYRTDHHWTTLGAYQGYLAYCEAKGLTPVPLDNAVSQSAGVSDTLDGNATPEQRFTAQTVTEEFAGTLYSKVNDYSHKKDTITIYTNPADHLKVTYTDTGEVADSLYNMEYLKEKDKYSMFLNNIHTLVEIENETAESEGVLMLIKDSYANSMVPFLAHHYRKIYVFDTRYYKEGPSNFLADHPEVTDILLLYNMNTIDTDSGIRGIY